MMKEILGILSLGEQEDVSKEKKGARLHVHALGNDSMRRKLTLMNYGYLKKKSKIGLSTSCG
jgi:hypothetical protein